MNTNGEIIVTTRKTLILLSKSLFSILFNGRWEQRLHIDDDGNIFFDFNPLVFRHLIDQLQLSNGKSISPPFDPSLTQSFEKMIRKLQLKHLLLSEKNFVTTNVDGQIITIHRSNSTENNLIKPLNSSKLSTHTAHVFIDYHPKVFRHFIKYQKEK